MVQSTDEYDDAEHKRWEDDQLDMINYRNTRPGLRSPKQLNQDKRSKPTMPNEKGQGIPEILMTKIYLNKLWAVCSTTETFKVDFWISIAWIDERLKYITSDEQFHKELEENQFWRPDVFYTRADGPVELLFTGDAQYRLLKGKDGIVMPGYIQLYNKVIATMTSAMNIQAFPFDVHAFGIEVEMTKGYQVDIGRLKGSIESCNKCFPEDVAQKIALAQNLPSGDNADARSQIEKTCSEKMHEIGEWELHDFQVKKELGDYYTFDSSCWGNVTYEVVASRRYQHFLWKNLPINLMTLLFSYFSMLVPPRELGTRLSLLFAVLLSMVAFSLVQTNDLPKRPTLTTWDCYTIMNYCVNCALTIEACAMNSYLRWIESRNNEEMVEHRELLFFVVPTLITSVIYTIYLIRGAWKLRN